ncbi:tRNA preQ1(34) S-adenosylmethionine ribosyltransferase-isomerase QueA [Candidatus Woesebacteria bacterium]|nr:tRNA preQ1(34) S-adenosylmethionine ribosyltransferase-isomerase QueA [Candidatus Woesebacteria bacterium]
MKLTDFNYELPGDRIAKVPVVPRDSSKLLVLNKHTGQIIDDHFYNLADYLQSGDLLVRNNTKVIPARIFGKKETGGKVEILLTKKIAHSDSTETWECLTKPGIKPGQKVFFESDLISANCLSITPEHYTRILEFNQMGPEFIETLEKIGITPLPPYISDTTVDSDDIRKKYQTIYAKYDGSAAAPTAGLHFTKDLEKKLTTKGIQIAEVTLHVGLGTFLPVKTENILEHHMHSEWFEITQETAELIMKTKTTGGRIVCVGTTSSRVLESASKVINNKVEIEEKTGETDIFMYPGYKYKIVDGLITNFHLPKSTLLMLVSALVTTPNTKHEFTNFLESVIGKAYLHAIQNDYRFFSFGDGMLII